MQLSDKQIGEYQRIYKKEFNKDISKEGAREQGLKLINFVKLIFEDSSNKDKKQLK